MMARDGSPGAWRTSRLSAGAITMLVLIALLVAAMASPTAAAAGPSLTILSPANDEVVGNGGPVIVRFAVSNFTLVQPGRLGQGANATEGHVDVYVDGTYVRLLSRVEPVALDLASGPHAILLRLVLSNGTPLNPDVTASVRAIVTQGPPVGNPSIRILSPVPGQVTGHDVYFAMEVTNFALVDPRGQPNAPREGHVQLFLNGVFQQEPRAYAPGFIVDMPDGDNTVIARLVNNDGTPLNPDVTATVTIHVKGSADPTPSALATGGISGLLAVILVVLLWRRRRTAARFADEGAQTRGIR